MLSKILLNLDNFIYNFLMKNVEIMPMRMVKYVAFFYTDARVRKVYLRKLGVSMGENTYSNLGFRIVSDDYKLRVRIGDHVSIAPNVVLIVCSSANNGQLINEIKYVKERLHKADKIIIEDEVWIGANVTILPGIRIGKCSVIGAGSVVTKSVDPYTIVAGNPAKVLRKLEKTGNEK